MPILTFTVTFVSFVLFVQSFVSLYLMLYAWENPEQLEKGRGPTSFLSPRLTFTVLLPARHEEKVIYETVMQLAGINYPKGMIEVIVICHADDPGTIAEAERAIHDLPIQRARVVVFSDPPINKPHGLNAGFKYATNQVVTVVDAEDDLHPDLFNIVNTVMLSEEASIVQAGVQLMNIRDHWFAAYNCLEYYFWFRSRLHFHAKVGMIPLGGNTVFIQRKLIEQIGGWDENCLTEDADIGLRLSALGATIRVVYDANHATREETPENTWSFIRQRTRWHQGFLQVLVKGAWLGIGSFGQRTLAIYTLSYPLIQAGILLLWPLVIVSVLSLKLPVLTAMLSFLPLYALFFQFLANMIGIILFAKDFHLKVPFSLLCLMAVTFLPYQWMLSFSSARAVYRFLRQSNNWEKTSHVGAHRQSVAIPVTSSSKNDPHRSRGE